MVPEVLPLNTAKGMHGASQSMAPIFLSMGQLFFLKLTNVVSWSSLFCSGLCFYKMFLSLRHVMFLMWTSEQTGDVLLSDGVIIWKLFNTNRKLWYKPDSGCWSEQLIDVTLFALTRSLGKKYLMMPILQMKTLRHRTSSMWQSQVHCSTATFKPLEG